MARINTINTLFAKNAYRLMDSSMYSQPIQTQAQYVSSALCSLHIVLNNSTSKYSASDCSPNSVSYFETPLKTHWLPFQT